MMHEIFNSVKRPFFASCTPMNLEYIAEDEYSKFIRKMFENSNREIDDETLNFICTWTMRHTFYTQYFCNFIYASKHKNIKLENVKRIAYTILKTHESTFYQFRNLLTTPQWKTLSAIAKEERLHQPTATSFIQKYRLGTPSTVSRSIHSLLEKEMILHNTSVEKPYYEVYDKFLLRWLETNN